MTTENRTRHSTITVRGLDGTIHQGDGTSMALAARDLAERHAHLTAELSEIAGTMGTTYADAYSVCQELTDVEAAQRAVTRQEEEEGDAWRLTPAGASVVAGMRTQEYLDDATVVAAVRMEAAYTLAERLAQLADGGAA